MTYTTTYSLLEPGSLYSFKKTLIGLIDTENKIRRLYRSARGSTQFKTLNFETGNIILAVENNEVTLGTNDGQWLNRVQDGCWVLFKERKIFMPEWTFKHLEKVQR